MSSDYNCDGIQRERNHIVQNGISFEAPAFITTKARSQYLIYEIDPYESLSAKDEGIYQIWIIGRHATKKFIEGT